MDIKVGLLKNYQYNSFVQLLLEIHRYYHPDSFFNISDAKNYFYNHILTGNSDIIVAEYNNKIVGMAGVFVILFFHELDVSKSKQVQLKEFFVSEDYRNLGIGKSIMDFLLNYLQSQNCYRMDWGISEGNHSAVAFYRKYGAVHDPKRNSYKLYIGEKC